MLNPLLFQLTLDHSMNHRGLVSRWAGEAHAFAKEVDALVDAFRNTTNLRERRGIARTLLSHQSEGRLLWPLTALFDRSVLGSEGAKVLVPAVTETMPGMAEIRAAFQSAQDVSYADAARKSTLCLAMWKYVVGFRLASTARIDGPNDFSVHHYRAIVDFVRRDGLYDSRISFSMEWAIRNLAEYYRRNDPAFGDIALAQRPHKKRLVSHATPDASANLEWLSPAWDLWTNGLGNLHNGVYKRALVLLNEFLGTLPLERRGVEVAFRRQNAKALMDYVDGWATPVIRRMALSRIRDFSVWMSRESGADGTEVRFHSELFEEDIQRLKVKWGTSGNGGRKDMTRPMPLKFHSMLKEIIAGDDFAWPKSLRNRRFGQLTQWFSWKASGDRVEQVFCPVLSRLLLLLLELPIRGVQARRLDSGEGDDRRWEWNGESGRWIVNTGQHSGYWRRADARNVERGVIHEIVGQGGRKITGLWINSNKTQDRDTLSDETSGYRIPWENEDLLRNLDAMRTWQETYNPVHGPLPHHRLSKGTFADDPSDLVSPHIPDRFYLFRTPLNAWPDGYREPPSHSVLNLFFWAALDELERRWNLENPDDQVAIVERDKDGAVTKARFTIHGMRSATLTGLHEAGVPIGIISKLVAGHATILMTLRYMNYEPQHVSDLIHAARVDMDSRAQSQFQAFLKTASYQEMMRKTAGVGDENSSADEAKFDASLCSRLDIGVCPNGGTMCHAGALGKKDTEIEVPGGPRNCIRCRFFRTGYAFLIPLWAKGNALLAKSDGLAREAQQQGDEVVRLKAERLALQKAGRPLPAGMRERINSLNEAHLTTTVLRDRALGDFHAALELIEKVRALGREEANPADPDLPAPIHAELPEVQARPSSRYELTDSVVQASRFYASLASPDMERERDGMTDLIAMNNGYMPLTLTMLGQAERKRSADALARLFLTELDGMEVQNLIDGRTKIGDHRGLEQRFQQVCLETTGREVAGIGRTKSQASLDVVIGGQ